MQEDADSLIMLRALEVIHAVVCWLGLILRRLHVVPHIITGASQNQRIIPSKYIIHDILSPPRTSALLGFFIITDCDTTGRISGTKTHLVEAPDSVLKPLPNLEFIRH